MGKRRYVNTHNVNSGKIAGMIGKNKLVLLSVLFIVGIIVFGMIDGNTPRNYYIKDIKISRAVVSAFSNEDGKMYLKLDVISESASPVFISSDDSWVEVKPEFFRAKNLGSGVGVLLTNYEIYKPKFWGVFGTKGQVYEGERWGIEEIYDTYEAAEQYNPHKNYNKEVVLKKKKTTADGRTFFVLEADERKFKLQVDNELYNRYKEGQSLKCEFDAWGESIKCVRVIS